MKEVGGLFEELIRAASTADPKWVVEPGRYPHAVYDSPEVVEAARRIVGELGLKGDVAYVVMKISVFSPLITFVKFYDSGGGEVLGGYIALAVLKGGGHAHAPSASNVMPAVWINAASLIRAGVKPRPKDAFHVLGESARPAYEALYRKLLEGFCQRAEATVCTARVGPARGELKA